MFNGSICKIQVVRHVKGLKKNLLSISQLDDVRCKTHLKGGILKFVKGALVVIKVEKITLNLYILLADMLQEVDALVGSDNQEEKTMLWHHKLDHMSERGLKILA